MNPYAAIARRRDPETIAQPPAPPEPRKPTAEELKARAIAALEAETTRTILERYPEHTQRNMLARGLALVADGKADSEEAQGLRAAWAWIDEQRAAYRQRRAELES